MSLTKLIRNTEKLLVMVLPSVLTEEIPGKAIIQAGEQRQLYHKREAIQYIFTEFKHMVLFFFFWSHRVACGILLPQPGIEPIHAPCNLSVES